MKTLLTALLLMVQPASAPPGEGVRRSVEHDGRTRTWTEFVPAACSAPNARCMTVVLLHGGGGGRGRGRRPWARAERPGGDPEPGRAPLVAALVERTGMAAAARQDGFVLLVPVAVDGNWNDGRPGIAEGIDDVGFLRAMLADAGRRTPIDPERTFVTGVSNGGLMSFRMACEASDAVRAIAPVVANMGQVLASRCPRGRPVDVIQILGERDPLMPYGGGGIGGRAGGSRGGVMSADDSLRFWSGRLEGAAMSQETPSPDVTLRRATGRNGQVEQYSLSDYGHGWPGADEGRGLLRRIRGENPSGFDATRRVLAFFASRRPR